MMTRKELDCWIDAHIEPYFQACMNDDVNYVIRLVSELKAIAPHVPDKYKKHLLARLQKGVGEKLVKASLN